MAAAQQVIREYEQLLADRRPWEHLWQQIGDLVLPRKSTVGSRSSSSSFPTVQTPGISQTKNLFDSTAIDANNILASSMQGTLTSNVIRWFSMRMRLNQLNAIKEVQDWLELSAETMWRAFQQSNFVSEVNELYLDLGAFGTGNMFVGTKERTGFGFPGFLFQTNQIGTYAIAEDAEGRVNAVYRTFMLSAQAAFDKWGDKVGEKILQRLDRRRYEKVEILHAVFPRKPPFSAAATKRPWASVYIALNEKHKIVEEGFFEFPFVSPRWAKASGEIYGRGPGHTSLPDNRTLNKLVELKLRAMAKAVDPPMKATEDSAVGKIRITPAAITYLRDVNDLQPLNQGVRYDVVNLEESKLQASIRRMFFADQLQLPPGQTVMTATEVERRIEIMQRILGPTAGRLISEFLTPLIDRSFAILLREGQLPQPPDVLIEAAEQAGGNIDIEYQGPLARAQKLAEIDAWNRFLGLLLPIRDIDPSVTDIVEPDAAGRNIATITGVNPLVIRGMERVEQIRQERAAVQQAEAEFQQQLEMMKAQGQAAPAAREAREAGVSPEDITGGA